MPLGKMFPPNLPPAGSLPDWSDGELLRLIQDGTNPDGHLSPVMSAMDFRHASDEDAHAIVAYLRSQPAIQNEIEQSSLTPLTLAFIALGMFPFKDLPEADSIEPAPVPVGPTSEYGRYITTFLGCSGCHGDDRTGGAGGLSPKGPSLRIVKGWSADQCVQTIRTGVNPTGRVLDEEEMPWRFIFKLDDDELKGVYAYLLSFP